MSASLRFTEFRAASPGTHQPQSSKNQANLTQPDFLILRDLAAIWPEPQMVSADLYKVKHHSRGKERTGAHVFGVLALFLPGFLLLKMWCWHRECNSDLLCPHPLSPARLYGAQHYPKQSVLLLSGTWSCRDVFSPMS